MEEEFKNLENFEKYFDGIISFPDEMYLDGKHYFMEQYGEVSGRENVNYVIFTDKENNDSYFKVLYSMYKVGENRYEGVDKILQIIDYREPEVEMSHSNVTLSEEDEECL